jgi:hypothetical protein
MSSHTRSDLGAALRVILDVPWTISLSSAGVPEVSGYAEIQHALSGLSLSVAAAGELVVQALRGLVASSSPVAIQRFALFDAQALTNAPGCSMYRRALAGHLRAAISGERCNSALQRLARGARPGLVETWTEIVVDEAEREAGMLVGIDDGVGIDAEAVGDLIDAIKYMANRSWGHRIEVSGRLRLVAEGGLRREILAYRDAGDAIGEARHIAGQALMKFAKHVDRQTFRLMSSGQDPGHGAVRAFLKEVARLMVRVVSERGVLGLDVLLRVGCASPLLK